MEWNYLALDHFSLYVSSMLFEMGSRFGLWKQRFGHLLPPVGRWRVVAVSGLLLLVLYVSSFNRRYSQDSADTRLSLVLPWWYLWPVSSGAITDSETNLSHIMFGVVSSANSIKYRKAFVESWWRPNISRGYMYMDRAPDDDSLFCPLTCPELRINENITNWEIYPKIKDPLQIRMVRTILEMFRQGDKDVRWFVLGDDDTVFFMDNIAQVLSKYDHTKYFYLGSNSETIIENAYFTFEMGFGGGGFALSYPLVTAMAKTLDGCFKRYPYMRSADLLTYICILELGVPLSPEKGFHQMDLVGNIRGFLSSHPQTPLLSLHHLEKADPIFPSLNKTEALLHLMKPAGVDQSRLLQQTICYQKENNWSISVSWGYSAHIYENILPRFILRMPIETFGAITNRAKWPKFMFNVRLNKATEPCEAPHWFFFESIERKNEDDIVTIYSREAKRGLAPCSAGGNHSAEHINRIRVISPAKTRLEAGTAECCDVLPVAEKNTTTVRIRPCREAEEII